MDFTNLSVTYYSVTTTTIIIILLSSSSSSQRQAREKQDMTEGRRSVDPLPETRTAQKLRCAAKYAVTFGVKCSKCAFNSLSLSV
jgi:hypothetical protein